MKIIERWLYYWAHFLSSELNRAYFIEFIGNDLAVWEITAPNFFSRKIVKTIQTKITFKWMTGFCESLDTNFCHFFIIFLSFLELFFIINTKCIFLAALDNWEIVELDCSHFIHAFWARCVFALVEHQKVISSECTKSVGH